MSSFNLIAVFSNQFSKKCIELTHSARRMASKMKYPTFLTNTPLHPTFKDDILDTHLVYDYDAQDASGNPEKWRYELWCFSKDRVVYAIHGGPMAGRVNYQQATYQCIRPGELWQINWLEETGTIVSVVYDMKEKRITSLIAFSQGHWENAKEVRMKELQAHLLRNLEPAEKALDWRDISDAVAGSW